MKKISFFLVSLILLGAGCVKLPQTTSETIDTYGTSHFGTSLALGETGTPKGLLIEGGWVRPYPGPFWWDAIERTPGVFDWTLADQEVAQWNKENQALLVTIWPFAGWDQATCHANEPKVQDPFFDQQIWLSSVCNVEAYQRFITAVVERYDGDGIDDMPNLTHPVKHWEIGNEPDMQTDSLRFYQTGPIAYAETLRLSYESIKQADGSASILTAGQSNMQENGTSFFRQVLPLAREQFDIANIHSISANPDFNTATYRSFINGLGFEQKPFWVTEVVVGSSDTASPWDEDTNARMTFEGYVNAFANGAERVFSFENPDPSSQETFMMMAETIGQFEKAERIQSNAVLFTIANKSVFALWDGATLPGDYGDKKFSVIRYDGSKDKLDASTLKAEVPMFVFVE